ncbi:FAD-binding and (Fe-S)-binding domain-containing protein [Sphaerisporangium sp. NPDC051011]|uniref:FAD-binding and (Fe-S)-binding domain-containing protein n=1 Tax=Sphaerisporangium sp. NPDC051011 TaxID=3155792 RepID=UPI0033CB96C3
MDIRADAGTRAAYSSDASLYRVPPLAVAYPRTNDDIARALTVCRDLGTSLTVRGAGTSVAGNSIGAGLVLDLSRYFNRIGDVSTERRTVTVQSGAVQKDVQRAAARHGLRYGPDPSTSSRCTIGGMIGNNACGTRSLAYGRTVDTVEQLTVLLSTGDVVNLSAGTVPQLPQFERLRALVLENLFTIRTEFGKFHRQVSGYALEHLLPENGFDLRRAFVGSEGTLGVILDAELRLVVDPTYRVMVVLGFDTIAQAGEAAPLTAAFRPTACEGLDSRLVDVVRAGAGVRLPELPTGSAWLFVEVAGDDQTEVMARARDLARSVPCRDSAVIVAPGAMSALWRIRADGAGLAGRSPAGRPAHSGWEDSAVPPARLGDYLHDLDELFRDHGLTGMPYGHFGEGCVHVRLDVPLDRVDGPAAFRRFMTDAAHLVVAHGGSLSGEHGDGRARSELLPLMYSPSAIGLFAQVKALLDPDGVLNPGVLVDAAPLDQNIRVAQAQPSPSGLAMLLSADGGDFTQAVHRCTGVGKCRAEPADHTVMCPSFQATKEEMHSTRGRARILQEAISRGGRWDAPEVHEALDLCLMCKGCSTDCPSGVDMAMYKSEVLYQSYRGKLRPATHYTLGWLPRWLTLAGRMPRLANALARVRPLGALAKRLAGIDHRRTIPTLNSESLRTWISRRKPIGTGRRRVVLWIDTFTNTLSSDVGQAAVRVLERAGYEVLIPPEPACCGLTLISTGQLDRARASLEHALDVLYPYVREGLPVVGLDPSCAAVLRSDIRELLKDPRARELSAAVKTLAELLTETPGWKPPDLSGVVAVAQPHCHHHAVFGWDTDQALLERAGARVTRLGGCCGLAGNFGVERGHYDVSVAVARLQLLPALDEAPDDAVVLADGYSCRTQISDLSSRSGVHLAQLLDRADRNESDERDVL